MTRAPLPPFRPARARLEVVRGTVVASARHVTGGHVSDGGRASLSSTAELWVATPDGGERRLVGLLFAEARLGHEVATVLQERRGHARRWQAPVCLANLSTATTWLDARADPSSAWGWGPGAVLGRALLLVPALAVPVFAFAFPLLLTLLRPLLPRSAEEAAASLLAWVALLALPVLGVWLSRGLGRWDLARREALLAQARAALARAGVNTGHGTSGRAEGKLAPALARPCLPSWSSHHIDIISTD